MIAAARRQVEAVLAGHAAALEAAAREADPAARAALARAREVRWALARRVVQQLRLLGSGLPDADLALWAEALGLEGGDPWEPDDFHDPDFTAAPARCRGCGAALRGDGEFLGQQVCLRAAAAGGA